MKRFLVFLALLLLVSGVLSWTVWTRYQDFIDTPLALPHDGSIFQLEAGMSGRDIVVRLEQMGLARSGWEWKVLMRIEPRVYKAGEYRLAHGLKPTDLLDVLASGEVIHYRLTLVEGWTFRQFVEALQNNPVLEHELDLADVSRWPLQESVQGTSHPEGWFLPETYQFTRGDSDRDILQRAHRAMKQVLQDAWESRNEDLPLDSPYQLLVLASIVEKETAVEAERDQVAGVFIRRLRKGMRLQTDPTVIYGIGEAYDGNIRRRDLQTDTPYNTYTRHGLPPTPIAMPGKASLFAAGHPLEGDALYFVADGKGGHTFSATLEEHQAAVRKLIGKK